MKVNSRNNYISNPQYLTDKDIVLHGPLSHLLFTVAIIFLAGIVVGITIAFNVAF